MLSVRHISSLYVYTDDKVKKQFFFIDAMDDDINANISSRWKCLIKVCAAAVVDDEIE